MKRTNISIFIPHIGCPHRCSFCDQRTISGAQKPPTADEVSALLCGQAPHLTENGTLAQIAFFGGSFTAIPRGYMEELLKAASDAVKRFPCYTGIRCSTRPDCISEEILELLASYGMTAIELGAQSMNDEVLKANERGHTADDVRRAARLIRQSGIELGLQMMTGLYKDTPERCLYTADEFIKLSPDTVRIYPTVILKNTTLGSLYEKGEYKSFGFDETVELCAKLLSIFESNNIQVIRLGLHSSGDISRDMLGGVYHPAFREIVESRAVLRALTERFNALPNGNYAVFTDKRNISRVIGQKRCNIRALGALGYNIIVKEREGETLDIAPQKEI